ncbi:MAG: hypothetical protein HOM55_06695 [Proteobacteria bacterium]|nr:hypothetical protein [Pseudomonadota bacterium]
MRGIIFIIGQSLGVLSGIGVFGLWSFAMWGPTSVLSLSGTSFFGAFTQSLLAVFAIIASVRGHSFALGVIFFISFFPIGFYFLSEAHWLNWTSWLDFGYLFAALLMWKTRKSNGA